MENREAAKDLPRIEHQKFVLDNGLQVIIHVDRRLPIVHVNQWYHVGSKNERVGRTGFAHLFEHLMFEGSKNADGEYFKYVERIGANLREGGANGTTSQDRTNYFVTAPSGSLEFLLWLESDRLATLQEAMTQEKLDNQREVVRNERRQTYENRPYGRAFPVIFENLFPAGHAYSWAPIGSHEDLEAASLEDVKRFFETWYTPNNLTLIIAGDLDPDRTLDWARAYFGSIPPGPSIERLGRMPVSLDHDRLVTVTDRVAQAKTYMVWPAMPFFEKGESDLDLLSLVLSNGLSSRLQKLLIYEKRLCASVGASMYGLESAGMYFVVATARPGVEIEPIEDLIEKELETLACEGPRSEEVKRALNAYELDFVSGLERIGGFGGRADRLAMYNTYFQNPDMIGADLGRYRSSTADSMAQSLATWVTSRKRLTVRFLPETASLKPAVQPPDRTRQPAPAPDPHFEIPTIHSTRLENGLAVYVIQRMDLPKFATRFVVRAGAADEAESDYGRTLLSLRLLDKGTANRDALGLQEAFADLGTGLGKVSGRESSSLFVDALSRDFEPVLDLLTEVIRQPAFPLEELGRERDRVFDDLVQIPKDAGRIAGRLAAARLFGANHPYSHPSAGSRASLTAFGRDDMVAFHNDAFVGDRAALIVAGNLGAEAVFELVKDRLGTLPRGQAVTRARVAPQAFPAGHIYAYHRPRAAQSLVYQLLPGVPRSHPEYEALTLVDSIWGGSFNSRLNMNIREDKGYSYGVSSGLAALQNDGYWQAGGNIQTEHTGAAMVEMARELDGLVGEMPLTGEELEDAKSNRIRGFSQSFETLSRLAGHAAGLFSRDIPVEYLAQERTRIEATTLEQARRAACSHLDPREVRWLVVGDMDQIESDLKSKRFGSIVMVTEADLGL